MQILNPVYITAQQKAAYITECFDEWRGKSL